jgi:7-keto-8-aminopelargonate synthetase-like enzyme
LECQVSASFVEHKTCISNWKEKISDFFGTEDAILYASCFDANGGVFEPLLQKTMQLYPIT